MKPKLERVWIRFVFAFRTRYTRLKGRLWPSTYGQSKPTDGAERSAPPTEEPATSVCPGIETLDDNGPSLLAARAPCPGQPKIVEGSKWLQQDNTWGRNRGNRTYSRYYFDYRYSKEYYHKQQGLEGERYVLERIMAKLDSCWTVFTNLELFEKQGDVDIALVGPGGLVALEVKNYSRRDLAVVFDDWIAVESNVPETYCAQPSQQAKDNALKMELYLESYHLLGISVRPVVVMASDVDVTVHESEIEVWSKNELDGELDQLNSQQVLPPEEINRIVAILSGKGSTIS